MCAAARSADFDVQTLRESFRGTILEPGDVGYDDGRTVYNGMIDRPALIARCTDVADVIRVVTFARESSLAPAVRGGGHSGPGFGLGG